MMSIEGESTRNRQPQADARA